MTAVGIVNRMGWSRWSAVDGERLGEYIKQIPIRSFCSTGRAVPGATAITEVIKLKYSSGDE